MIWYSQAEVKIEQQQAGDGAAQGKRPETAEVIVDRSRSLLAEQEMNRILQRVSI